MTPNQVQAIKNQLEDKSRMFSRGQEAQKIEETRRSNRAQEDLKQQSVDIDKAELARKIKEFEQTMGYKWAELPSTYLSSIGSIFKGAGSLGLGV